MGSGVVRKTVTATQSEMQPEITGHKEEAELQLRAETQPSSVGLNSYQLE